MSRRSSRANELKVGALLLVAVAVFAWLSVQIGALSGLGGSISVTVVFEDAAGLVPDSAVKVAGVQVGSVRSLVVDFDKAVATLALDKDAGLRRDVRASIRARSLLGEKFVALEPRGSEAPLLQGGDVIADAAKPVEIDALIAAFGPLLEQVNPDDVGTLIHGLAQIAGTLGERSNDLGGDLSALLKQLALLAELAPTLKEELPPMLSEGRGLIRRLDRTTGKAEGLVDDLSAVTRQAGGSLTKVDEAVAGVPALVSDAQGVVDALEPSVDDLARALESSDEAVARLNRILKGFEDFDEEALRRLLRQEGVLVRLKPESPEKAARRRQED